MHVHYYSQRLLNPFRGVVNCIRYKSAEAVTCDGNRWDIYVSNDALLEGLDDSKRIQTSDIRYGSWSAETGLKRGPLCPSEDFKLMEQMGAVVYEHLLQLHTRVPFPFMDRFELWLLDTQARPLALLNSVTNTTEIEPDQAIDWRPGLISRKTFIPPMTDSLSLESTHAGTAADYLAHYINACAGPSPSAQWFERLSDSSGLGLDGVNLGAGLRGRNLASADFPSLFVEERNHDAPHRLLVREFLDWQAPWLLLLASIDRPTRQHLEEMACKQALVVERQHRLYPCIIDIAAIRAARVQATLHNSRPEPETTENIMSTFYIELQ